MKRTRILLLMLSSLVLVACASPYDRGMQAYEEGRYQESIEHFESVKAWDEHADDAEVMISRASYKAGRQAYENGNWDKALQFLNQVRRDRYADARDLMGDVYYQKGREAYEEQNWTTAINHLLMVRPESGKYQEARRLLAEVRNQSSS